MTCKRSKQCDNADLCRFAQSDDYNLLGGSCFTLKGPQTNEEWLRSASTEELAYILRDTYLLGYTHGHNGADIHGGWSEWLKQLHTSEE